MYRTTNLLLEWRWTDKGPNAAKVVWSPHGTMNGHYCLEFLESSGVPAGAHGQRRAFIVIEILKSLHVRQKRMVQIPIASEKNAPSVTIGYTTT